MTIAAASTVAVIGGRGFVGRRVVAALAGSGFAAWIDHGVDVDDPATFERLDGAAVVIDAGPAGRGDALARHCLTRGLVMIDCSAHAPTTRALLSLAPSGPGAVVVGAGLFPGVSNLIAAREPDTAAVLVELDPLSGAGASTIDALVGALAGPQVRAVRAAGGFRPALVIDSSDAAIADAGGAPIELWITCRQRWLARLLPLAAWLGRRRVIGRLAAAAAGLAMRLIRGRLLRRRPTSIALYTVAAGGAPRARFRSADGFAAVARAVAWAAVTAARRGDLGGVVSFAELASTPAARTAPAARS